MRKGPLRNPGQFHHNRQWHRAIRPEASRVKSDEINKAPALNG